jgi:hypothetical protein
MPSKPLIQMNPVVSSMLDSIGHDPETQTLAVRFKAKGDAPAPLRHYANVTAEVYAALAGAESVGKHFHAAIKSRSDLYPSAKISELEGEECGDERMSQA